MDTSPFPFAFHPSLLNTDYGFRLLSFDILLHPPGFELSLILPWSFVMEYISWCLVHAFDAKALRRSEAIVGFHYVPDLR